MITLSCPHCQKKLKVKDELAGKKVKCPACGKPAPVPLEPVTDAISGSAEKAARPEPSEERTLAPRNQDRDQTSDGPTILPDQKQIPTGATRIREKVAETTQATAREEADGPRFDFLAPSQEPDEIGRLGPYRVLKVLGAGGMGVVFRAEDPQLKRPVALKAMLPSIADSGSAKKRFLREAQAAAGIKHDHIVAIYQVGEDRGAPYLAMEFLEGEPLDKRLEREGKLPVADVLRIGRQIAEGLAAAHDKGLIHRDIKPANVWLESRVNSGQWPVTSKTGVSSGPLDSKQKIPSLTTGHSSLATFYRAKILDFGLARATGDQTQLTQSGAIVGTPAYMAPEQASADEVDHRCDLFSLGSTLYRMSTGVLPFKGKDTIGILSSLALDNPKEPRLINPEIPARLNDLIMHLMAKAPADRPASAQAVVEALAALEAGDVGHAALRALRRPRRRPLLLAGGAAVLLLVLGYFFAPVLIRIATNKGELIVEADDPNIEITIKDGTATLFDRARDRRFVLTAGDYDVEVREPGDGGVRFSTRKFTITRGGKETLQARLELAKAPFSRDPKGSAPPASAPAVFSSRPMSAAALVSRPAPLPGVQSWTVETIATRGYFLSRSRPLAVSPDGQQVAAATADATIRIWDLASGKLQKALLAHTNVSELAWSPDGKWLASSESEGPTLVWDPATGGLVHRFEEIAMRIAWSPDSKYLASGWGSVCVRDVASGQSLASKDYPGNGVGGLSWSPDGARLALGYRFGGMSIWDWKSGKQLREWKTGNIVQVAWSPDGKRLASRLHPEGVQLWDADTGKPLPVERKEWPSVDIAWSPDGKLLATGWNTLQLCDPASGKPVQTLDLDMAAQGLLAWSRNGKTLALATGTQITAWDMASKQVRAKLQPHPGCADWSMSPDGRLLAANPGEQLRVFDLAKGTHRVGGSTAGTWRITFSPDGKLLSSGREVVQTDSLKQLAELPMPAVVWNVALSPDNKQLARPVGENIEIWDIAARKTIHTWPHKLGDGCRALAWSPDGKTLAASNGYMVALWEAQAGKERARFKTTRLYVATEIAWSPDGKLLAVTAHSGYPLAVLDAISGKELWGSSGSGMRWRPDSKSLDCVDISGWLRSWHRSGQQVSVLGKFPHTSLGLASRNGLLGTVHPHGQGESATVRLWKQANGRPTGALVFLSQERFLAVSPDGHYRGSPGVVNELVYVARTDKGQETLTPAEFSKRFNWKNDPDRVKLLGPDVPDNSDVESFSPPSKAVVRFSGKNLDSWNTASAKIADSVLQVGEEPLVGKQDFGGRFRLHLEFRLPDKGSQGAVEVQGRYRVHLGNSAGQRLDARSSCGAIYAVVAPKADAARPVGAWQNLDLDFTSRQVDGKSITPAKLTVLLNEYPVHANESMQGEMVELPGPTPQAMFQAAAESGPVVLYGSGKGVQFRNIWLEPR